MRFYTNLLILLLGSWRVFGQPPDLSIKYFDKSDGLSSSNVNFVAQDSTGFIWVASIDGLFKYDGYGFKAYRNIRRDSSSLTGNNVNYLYSDKNNRLWVSTTAGLCWYNRETDKFINVAGRGDKHQLSSYNFHKITSDLQGNILVCNENDIFRFNEKSKSLDLVFNSGNAGITDFLVDGNRLWVGLSSNKGLLKKEIGKSTSDTILKNITIISLALHGNDLWMAVFGGGVQKLAIADGTLTRYPFHTNEESIAMYITVDRFNRIWSVDFTGLKTFEPESAAFYGYYTVAGDINSIKSNIHGIFTDRQGNYWIYHQPGGLGICMKMKGFHHYFNNPNSSWHTSGSKVNAISEDSEGNLFMGYYNGGVDVFDWNSGKIRNYRHNDKVANSLGNGTVHCIYRDRQGTMWIGTYKGGLQMFDRKNNTFITFSNDPKNPASPAGNDIRAIAEDHEGNLWLAVHSKGVDKFDRKTNRFIHFNHADNQLSNDWPFSIMADHNDNIWVATAWGLNVLKKGEKKFISYLTSENDTNTLSSEVVNAIYEDSLHTIWVGTSKGLNRYNTGTDDFTRFEGVFENDHITGITSSGSTLWICTLSGISSLSSTNKVQNFDSADGLLSTEFSIQSVYRNRAGHLYFGGMKGIDIFNPESVELNSTPPAVILTGLQVLNKPLNPENSGVLTKQITYTQKIKLNYTDNVITFTFAAMNFINPEENAFAYRMRGFEEAWHSAGTSRFATYTNLDPGKYTFEVIACNNDGVWNKKGTKLELIIMPPWYRTVLFRIFFVAAIFGIVLLYGSIRTANLHKQRQHLEQAVKEKTAELNLQAAHLLEANKELERHNNTKDKLFSLISHDLVSPFNTIIGFADILHESYKDLSEKERTSYIRMISESSRKVFVLLNNLLIWSRSQTNQIQFNPSAVKLNGIIDEVIELNKQQLKAKNLNVMVTCPGDPEVFADIEMLKAIIRNLFSNAIKFSFRHNAIIVSADNDGKTTSISFKDNGPGLSKEKIDELLSEQIIHSEYGTNGETGTGLGLSLCKEFIKRNRGNFYITSEPGKGSNFTFTLPTS